MPTLKQLSCQIEWAGSNVPFKEYGTSYGDGFVESYIAIPNSSTPFSINLRSTGYVAPGLAMFVFMDGVYQCNRNRDDLRPISRPPEATRKFRDISFRVRQREERLPDGSWIGRPWRFERFQLVKSTGDNLDIVKHFEKLGTVQVVVLRCAAHPRAKYTGDDDISDGARTPESGMAPGSEIEDDDSISSDEWMIYENHSSRFQEGNGELWGAFGGLFDGPPHQEPYPHCCPSCDHPHVHCHARSLGSTRGQNARGCRQPWHAQQQPVTEQHCLVGHIRGETIIDAPDIPQCRMTNSRTQNPHCHSGCHNPQPNLPLNNHESSSHLPLPRSGHIHMIALSNGENPMSNISYGELQGDSQFFVPPIVLNINPQQFKYGPSRNDRNEICLKSNDNGYYMIYNGKRVPESSNCSWNERNAEDSGGVADKKEKKKSRSKRRSRGKEKQEQQQADSNQQGEGSRSVDNGYNQGSNDGCDTSNHNESWGNNGNQQQDRCGGVDGEATNNTCPESNQAVNANNDNPIPGDWNTSDNNHQSSSWNQSTDPSPNFRPSTASPNQPQESSMRQVRDFNQYYSPYRTGFVSPMFSEPVRDESPLYTVPEPVAHAENLSHQVQLGPQAKYVHRIRNPKYLDTMEKPYAEFFFKYRTADVIQNKFHVSVVSDIDEERRKLESLSRIEIVNQLLRAQGFLSNSDMINNRSPRTSPPAPFAQPQSPSQPMPPWNSSIARSPPCPPHRGQWQQIDSGGGDANTQSNDRYLASLNANLEQQSQNSNGGDGGWNGDNSWRNRSNSNNLRSTNDDSNDNSRPSWDTPSTDDASGGGNGGNGNGTGDWESGITDERGVNW